MRPSCLPVLLLLACASAPQVEYPALDLAQPDQWLGLAGASEDTVADHWWRDMGAARLDSLVALALAHNYDLKAAGARLAQAQAQARVAGAPLWPQLNASANGSRRKQNFVGLPIPGSAPDQVLSSKSTSFGVDLTASWEADLWGRLRAGAQAALADAGAAAADFRAARLSLAAQTARAYFAAVEAGRQVELAQATVANYRLSTEQIEDRLWPRLALIARCALGPVELGHGRSHPRPTPRAKGCCAAPARIDLGPLSRGAG